MERNILIADSQPLMAESIRLVLNNSFPAATLTLTFDAIQILKSVKEFKPTLIILDNSMGKPCGLPSYEKIKEWSPASKFLLFSSDDHLETVKAYFKKGVDGYLLRKASGAELLNAIAVVERGDVFLDQALQAPFSMSAIGKINKKRPKLALTRREHEILYLVVEGATTKEIAKMLFISPETAETHRFNLTQKFGVKNTAGLVREAFIRGVFQAPIYP